MALRGVGVAGKGEAKVVAEGVGGGLGTRVEMLGSAMGREGGKRGRGADQVLVAFRGVRVVGGGRVVRYSSCHPHGPARPCHSLTHERWLEGALLQHGILGSITILLHGLYQGLLHALLPGLLHGLSPGLLHGLLPGLLHGLLPELLHGLLAYHMLTWLATCSLHC